MTNRKDLKKYINYVCSNLFAECVAASLYDNNSDENNLNMVLKSILQTRDDFILRISHPEPGISAKKYYHILAANFEARVSEIVDNIYNFH